MTKFLNKYFPPSRSAKLRSEITFFVQSEGESLYDAWERFKDILRRCPHHAIPEWLQIQIFYNGLNMVTRSMVDAATRGTFNNKSPDEAYELLEVMANNHCHSFNERQMGRKGTHELNALDALLA